MSEQEITGLQSQASKRVRVVSGVLTRQDIDSIWEVLACQRRADQKLANKWHLPGGKVEKGETDKEAIARELFEELNIRVHVGEEIANICVNYPHGLFDIHFCRVLSFEGLPLNKDSQDMRWFTLADLSYANGWLVGDLQVAELSIFEKISTEWV